jgi:hypothetical protein
MKNAIVSFMFFIACSSFTNAQQAKPQILKEPANWEFERFPLPPVFAPAIPYKGAEELRFSPGMFKKDSADYFTYIFAAELNDITTISETEIKDYLLSYFKGLCGATARDRKLAIDTTQISVVIKKNKHAPVGETIYDATVNLFGVFADGAPVKLNMEINSVVNGRSKKLYLFFIASPREKNDPVWIELYEIRKKTIKGIEE